MGFLSLLSLPSVAATLCPVSEGGFRPERGFCPLPGGGLLLGFGAGSPAKRVSCFFLKGWAFTASSPVGAVDLCLGPGVGGFPEPIPAEASLCAHHSDSDYSCCLATAVLPGFGFFSLKLALTCIPYVALDFLLISPCCLDPHGLNSWSCASFALCSGSSTLLKCLLKSQKAFQFFLGFRYYQLFYLIYLTIY